MIEEAKRQGDEYAAIKYAEILRIQNEDGEAELKRADEIFLQYGNMLQRELLEKVPDIIAEAKREYQEHHNWGETEAPYVNGRRELPKTTRLFNKTPSGRSGLSFNGLLSREAPTA